MNLESLSLFQRRLGKAPKTKLGKVPGTIIPNMPPNFHRGYSDATRGANLDPKKISWYLRGYVAGLLNRLTTDDRAGEIDF